MPASRLPIGLGRTSPRSPPRDPRDGGGGSNNARPSRIWREIPNLCTRPQIAAIRATLRLVEPGGEPAVGQRAVAEQPRLARVAELEGGQARVGRGTELERVRAGEVGGDHADAAAVADDHPRAAGGDELVDGVGDPGGELIPGLAVGRGARAAAPVRQLVGLRIDLRRRAPAPLADVDLPPAWVGPAGLEPEQRGGLPRAGEVGGDNPLARDLDPLDQRLELERLPPPGLGQWRVELTLQPVLGVPGGLAMAHEDEMV